MTAQKKIWIPTCGCIRWRKVYGLMVSRWSGHIYYEIITTRFNVTIRTMRLLLPVSYVILTVPTEHNIQCSTEYTNIQWGYSERLTHYNLTHLQKCNLRSYPGAPFPLSCIDSTIQWIEAQMRGNRIGGGYLISTHSITSVQSLLHGYSVLTLSSPHHPLGLQMIGVIISWKSMIMKNTSMNMK